MMDRRERTGPFLEALLCAQEGHQSQIWTAMPGIIQSFDPAKRTCSVQPATKALVSKPDGTSEWVAMPLLVDCPVFFPGGGGFLLTLPLAAGDECIVVFASRCIDAWWQSGGVQVQAEMRMHSLSDGFCLPGIASVPNVAPSISTQHAMLRNAAGTVAIELRNDGSISIATTGNMQLVASQISLTGDVVINGERYILHEHTGVTTGASNTGPKA